jgi:hypothetical protein
MAWESALGSVIEVAIALVGFSGIVAAVGRRGAGHWSPVDQLRLRILLTAGGAALSFAFLPFTMIDAIDPALVWRLCSGLMAMWLIGIMGYRLRQTSKLGITQAVGYYRSVIIIQIGVVAMLVANAFWFASSSLYVVAVFWQTAIAFMTFVALLLDSWRQPPDAMPPST